MSRLTNRNINNRFNTNYSYLSKGNRTSLVVESIDNEGDKFEYSYDNLYNITKIYHNGILENEYFYDEYNQLVKEHNYILGNTIRYKYDNFGNILFKKNYKLKTYEQLEQNIYEYNNDDFRDLLTKFNNEDISYDGIGNPIMIGNRRLTWINGRQLSNYTDETNQINYKYNISGIRIKKVINNVETSYELDDENIIFEKTNNNVIYYIRSNANDLIGFKYNNDVYYYIKNNQDDIIGILDSNYNIVAKYQYDSFGNIISITDGNGNDVNNIGHIANINPFRYRSYYYDKETNLYYLNSRYYSPTFGRFINADTEFGRDYEIMTYNLFVYSNNNPVSLIDINGNFAIALPAALTVLKYVVGCAVAIGLTKAAAPALKSAAGDVISAVERKKQMWKKKQKNK